MRTILHPTDLSDGSHLAFAHALLLAVLHGARLHLLHVFDSGDPTAGGDFPSVRETLIRWGLLEEGASRKAVGDELDVSVKKITVQGRDAVKAVEDYVGHHPMDMLVLATGGRTGLARALNPSVAEALSRTVGSRTLFVRKGRRGFVTPADGRIELRRMLIPVDHHPDPGPAVLAAATLARRMALGDLVATVLHVGDGDAPPPVQVPEDVPGSWVMARRAGRAADQIVATAEEMSADLVVMSTEGHTGVMDAVRGSTTEQVVRNASCPVMAVPSPH